jgi:hypothetical protein
LQEGQKDDPAVVIAACDAVTANLRLARQVGPALAVALVNAAIGNPQVQCGDQDVGKAELGFDTAGDPPDVFGAIIMADIAKWAKVIREANIKSE